MYATQFASCDTHRQTGRNLTRAQWRRVGFFSMFVVGSVLSFSALAAGNDAQARYQQERAFCISGQSQQDQATCLKEAGAALQENRRNNLSTERRSERASNAENRCEVLRGDDKVACEARMMGMGKTEGSVAGGGIIREITIVKPAE